MKQFPSPSLRKVFSTVHGLFLFASFTLLFSSSLFAASPASVFDHPNESVTVRLLSPIAFGKFTSTSSGSVAVDARSGSCNGRGGAVMIRSNCARGVIELIGPPGEQIVVQLPNESVISGHSNDEAVLSNFTMDRDNPIILGSDGRARIGVGATLSGAGAMRNGEYAGQFLVQTMVLK